MSATVDSTYPIHSLASTIPPSDYFWGWELLCAASRLIPIHWVFYYWVMLPFLSQGNNTMLLIVKEYPSRSNLNSFPEFYEASAERVMNSDSILDCRHPLGGENHYQYLNNFKELTCSLVVDSHSRFTILSQQVNVLYEFPVSYHHLFYKDM